ISLNLLILPPLPPAPTYDVEGEQGYVTWDPAYGEVPYVPGEDFSEFKPSASTRTIYVSTSDGNDNNDGLTPQSPVRSIDRGYELLRDGYPDHMLLKRGDQFDLPVNDKGEFRKWKKSGRSFSEKMVVGSYGASGHPRPVVRSNGGSVIYVNHGETVKHVAFTDMHFLANHRVPGSPEYRADAGKERGIAWSVDSQDILFEGLLIEYFGENVALMAKKNDMREITFRRCVLRNAYTDYDDGHSQGLYAVNVNGLTFEGNVFDHNGWNEQIGASHRSGYNQGAYLSECNKIVVVGNIFIRNSYSGLKIRSNEAGQVRGIHVVNNFFADNLNAIQAWGDPITGDESALLIHDILIRDNVITRNGGQLNGVDLGTGIRLGQVANGLVANNLLVHKLHNTSKWAVGLQDFLPYKNVRTSGNVVHEWKSRSEGWTNIDSNNGDKVYLPSSRYVDANRNINLYVQTIGDNNGSIDQLARELAYQQRNYWREELTAEAINNYFRAGFE
ncbi:MAG: right-handed parallel beta-helix repeat-containing protein, partial [Rhodospirillales bacterium]|nr:right-handed parallel beta-helix repeat-containing protein [Rhodospirillales bacterium]